MLHVSEIVHQEHLLSTSSTEALSSLLEYTSQANIITIQQDEKKKSCEFLCVQTPRDRQSKKTKTKIVRNLMPLDR